MRLLYLETLIKMRSFTLYFKKSPAFFLALFTILAFEIGLYFIPNIHYFDGKGAFFTFYKRYIAEKGEEDFDILLYGDSRSLSLKGFPKSEQQKYSLYNFSLPAAGPWYFKYFLKKYLKHHHTKPKLIIWTVDPMQLSENKTLKFHKNPALWNEFKHRLLNLFSVWETWEQYEGRELFFILKEYIPHSMLSIRHRQGFESVYNSRLTSIFQIPTLVKENLLVESIVRESYGQINLGTFFFVPNVREIALKEKENQLSLMQHTNINLQPLEMFLDYCQEEGLLVVVLNIPRLKEFNRSPFFQAVVPKMKSLLSKYSNAKYLEFEEMEYELDMFSESIHYNEEGNQKVNLKFRNEIVPKLYHFIENPF